MRCNKYCTLLYIYIYLTYRWILVSLQEDWKKWDKWKEINESIRSCHFSYIKSQHYPMNRELGVGYDTNTPEKKFFECINPWGLLDVCPIIQCDSPAIKNIYEVSISKCEIIHQTPKCT